MKLKQCEKAGHFYDSSKFASCPHCEAANSQSTIPKTASYSGGGMGGKLTEAVETEDLDSLSAKVRIAMSQKKNKVAVNEESQKTVSYFEAESGEELPVGLLVCVEGASFGSYYSLKTGKNFIGRSESMDVRISGDKSVSREKHAIVVYEPKNRVFIAQPSGGGELFYLNGEVVLQAQTMNPYDEIALGNTKLMFIPICGTQFSWDDYE